MHRFAEEELGACLCQVQLLVESSMFTVRKPQPPILREKRDMDMAHATTTLNRMTAPHRLLYVHE